MKASGAILSISFIISSYLINYGHSVDCYVCNSVDNSTAACEDPFNTNHKNYLVNSCQGYKKNREGSFPADHCIKVNGIAGNTIMVRTCALDSGTLTADTEIVRMSHCGHFFYDGIYFRGCVQSCSKDGCNDAVLHWSTKTTTFGLVILLVILYITF